MDKDKHFPEQEAPVKNTDKAFVQVGEDGSPVMPSIHHEEKDIENENSPAAADQH